MQTSRRAGRAKAGGEGLQLQAARFIWFSLASLVSDLCHLVEHVNRSAAAATDDATMAAAVSPLDGRVYKLLCGVNRRLLQVHASAQALAESEDEGGSAPLEALCALLCDLLQPVTRRPSYLPLLSRSAVVCKVGVCEGGGG